MKSLLISLVLFAIPATSIAQDPIKPITIAGRIQAMPDPVVYQQVFDAAGGGMMGVISGNYAVLADGQERLSQALEMLSWCVDVAQRPGGCTSQQILSHFGLTVVPRVP